MSSEFTPPRLATEAYLPVCLSWNVRIFLRPPHHSGGINIPYTDVAQTIPTLVYWGGEGDSAFEQDFHGMSLEMIDTLSEAGHPLITCNHNTGHNIQPSYFKISCPICSITLLRVRLWRMMSLLQIFFVLFHTIRLVQHRTVYLCALPFRTNLAVVKENI